jgi:hypothetical protein
LEPQPADSPADPWFRPVWEEAEDEPPPLPRRRHAQLLRLPPLGPIEQTLDNSARRDKGSYRA